MLLVALDTAQEIGDMDIPGFKLHTLKGKLKGRWAVSVTGKSGISPEMALRLSKALGRSAESWLVMHDHHDLWQAKQHIKLDEVQHIKFTAA